MTTLAHDLDFRPLTREDIPLLYGWFNAPHARRWYGDTREEVDEEYIPMAEGEGPVRAFIVTLRGRPVGLFSWERFGDSPDFQRLYGVSDPDAANCDVILGEADIARQGLGSAAIRAFLERVIFADPRITACIIDPHTENFIAIRAYEKAGFRYLRSVFEDGDGASVDLLEIRREELDRPVNTGDFFVRPAREDELKVASAIDDDACALYAEAGIVIDTTRETWFFAQELEHWRASLDAGEMLFACNAAGEPVGFAAFGKVDGVPHLHQLSVRRGWMKRGIGRALLARVIRWSVRPGVLTLTTYDHLAWNRPFYEHEGFVCVDESECGHELRAIVRDERRALPLPECRVVMRYRHRRG
jgi:RimJ/RimL family protein N-acetyltransferase/predicted N-acetyltransferase YhbS